MCIYTILIFMDMYFSVLYDVTPETKPYTAVIQQPTEHAITCLLCKATIKWHFLNIWPKQCYTTRDMISTDDPTASTSTMRRWHMTHLGSSMKTHC